MAIEVGEIEAVLRLKDEFTDAFTKVWQNFTSHTEEGASGFGTATSNMEAAFNGFVNTVSVGGETIKGIFSGEMGAKELASKFVELTKTIAEEVKTVGETILSVFDGGLAAIKDFAGSAGIALAGVTGAVLGLWLGLVKMGEAGAKLDAIQGSFNQLAAGIKGGPEAAIEALEKGTQGLVDSFTMMSSVSRALATGWKPTTDQLTILGQAAVVVAQRGYEVKDSFNAMAVALATGRINALQHMGVLVDEKDALRDLTMVEKEAGDVALQGEQLDVKRKAIMEALIQQVKQAGATQLDFSQRVDIAKESMNHFIEEVQIAISRSPALNAILKQIDDALINTFGGDQQARIKKIMEAIAAFGLATAQAAALAVEGAQLIITAYERARGSVDAALEYFAQNAAAKAQEGLQAIQQSYKTHLAILADAASKGMNVKTNVPAVITDIEASILRSKGVFVDAGTQYQVAISQMSEALGVARARVKAFQDDNAGASGQLDAVNHLVQKAQENISLMAQKFREGGTEVRNWGAGINNTQKPVDILASDIANAMHEVAVLNAEMQRAQATGMSWSQVVKDLGPSAESSVTKLRDLGVSMERIPERIRALAEASKDGYDTAKQANADAINAMNDKIAVFVSTHRGALDIVDVFGKDLLTLGEDAKTYQNNLSATELQLIDFTRKMDEFNKKISEKPPTASEFGTLIFSEEGSDKVRKAHEDLMSTISKQTQTAVDFEAAQYDREAQDAIIAAQKEVDAHKMAAAEFEKYKNTVLALAAAKKNGLKENLTAEAENTQEALQAQADYAMNTWLAMEADPKRYSAVTRAAFKQIADDAIDKAHGVELSFHKAFTDMMSEIPSILQQAFTGGGGISGALKGIGTMVGSTLGKSIVSSMGEDDSPLAEFMKTGLGKMLGSAIPVIGSMLGPLISGLFNKLFGQAGRDAVKKFADSFLQVGDLSKGISGFDELHKKLQALGADGEALWIKLTQGVGKNNPQQAAKVIDEINSKLAQHDEEMQKISADADKVASGFNAIVAGMSAPYMKWIGISEDADGSFKSLYDRQQSLIASISDLQKKTSLSASQENTLRRDREELLSVTWSLAQKSGQWADAQKYLSDQLPELQTRFDRMGRLAVAAFASSMAAGKGLAASLEAIGPGLDQLNKVASTFGISASGTAATLLQFRQFANDNKELVGSIDGLNQMMQGLNETGLLTQDTFNDLTAQASDTFNQIIGQGLSSDQALQLMQPTLQTIWQLEQQFGYTVDDATQSLIDQSVAAGYVGEAHKTAMDRVADGVKRIGDILEQVFGVTLPDELDKTAKHAAGIGNEIRNIPTDVHVKVNYDDNGVPQPGGSGAVGDRSIGAATGGFVTPYGVQHFELGGYAMAPTGTDTVPAMLTPGEIILNAAQQRNLAGTLSSQQFGGSWSGQPITIEATVVSVLDGREVARSLSPHIIQIMPGDLMRALGVAGTKKAS